MRYEEGMERREADRASLQANWIVGRDDVKSGAEGLEMASVRTFFHLPACLVWCGSDPKGAGVLTTSHRYSRKRHIYTPSILLCPHSASILMSASFAALLFGAFSQTPGAIGTLLSNIRI